MEHKKFAYRNLDELKEDILRAGVELPVSERLDILKTSLPLHEKSLPNRLAIHPMEGCDGTAEGAPGELTFRRYERFGAGGAGLLWVEACAINNESRANPRHLSLNKDNLNGIRKLNDDMLSAAKASSGENFRPYTVLQLTHAGRYSKPNLDATAFVAVAENPYLDPKTNPKRHFVTDGELERLEDLFVETAQLTKKAGFDAIDIKGCHRYLISELFSAHTREGKYGGSFENRMRFLLNIIDKVKANVAIDVTLRINAYDALPYPYGWGSDEKGAPALDEPRRLMQLLWDKGIRMVNISTGNPYYNPHIGRPYDTGSYTPPEHQIVSAARMLRIIKEMKAATPEMILVGTGFSWFREFGANIAAGCIEQGWIDIAGFGRQSFAYPDFAKDIVTSGAMLRKKCCIACTKCTELMRFGGSAGCVIKDSKVYLPLWRQATNGQTMMGTEVRSHV